MKEKKIDIDKKSIVCIQWITHSMDYTKEQEETIVAYFARKYDIPKENIRVELVFKKENGDEDNALNAENINSIQDPQFQQSLFEPYLKGRGITDYDIDELYKIDSRVNSLVDFDAFNKGKRWSLQWIRWGNFLSFGPDNYFDFTTLHGLIQLNGEPANESGKSTFARDLVHFALFGRVSLEKARKNEQLFNNYLQDENTLHVSCCIVIDGEKYVIERELIRSKRDKKNPDKSRSVVNKVKFYRLLDNDSMEELAEDISSTNNLEGETVRKTSKIITDAIGSEADFDMIISADSKDLDSIISMKDTERGKMISRWNGLSVIEKKEEIAKKLHSEDSEGLYSKVYNRGTLETNIEENKAEIKNNENEIESTKTLKKENEDKLSDEKIKKEGLLSSMQQIDESLLDADVETITKRLESIVEDGKQKKAQRQTVLDEIGEIGDVSMDEEEYKSVLGQKEGCVIDITKKKAEISSLKETNVNLEKAEYCPVCKRKFDNVDNSGLIETNNNKIKQLGEEVTTLENTLKQLNATIQSMDDARKLVLRKNQLSLKESALSVDIERARNDYKETKQLIDEINKNKEAIEANNKAKVALLVVNTNISQYETTIQNLASKITACENTIHGLEEKNKENTAIIAKIEEEIKAEKNWSQYLEIIGKNGISKIVLNHAIPIMNAAVNRFLQDCADFNVEIVMTDNKDIEFLLVRDGVKTKLSAASGLERCLSSLALRVVLGKMSNLSKPPFLLLDEVLGTVAKENYDLVKKMFDKIKAEFDFVLHITHLTEIADWHDSQITVVKKNNISTIKTEE